MWSHIKARQQTRTATAASEKNRQVTADEARGKLRRTTALAPWFLDWQPVVKAVWEWLCA